MTTSSSTIRHFALRRFTDGGDLETVWQESQARFPHHCVSRSYIMRLYRTKEITIMTDLLQLPIVNLNGTSKAELLRQSVDAIDALEAARFALLAAVPNARDYQTVKGAFEIAREQHAARLGAVEVVIQHLQAIALGIDRQ